MRASSCAAIGLFVQTPSRYSLREIQGCIAEPSTHHHRECDTVVDALDGVVIPPRGRVNTPATDEEHKDQYAGNKIMGRENKLVLFICLEETHNLRSRSPYSSITESVPTPFVFQVFFYRNRIPMYSRYCGGSNWAIQGNATRNPSIASSRGLDVVFGSRVTSDSDAWGIVFVRLSGSVRLSPTRLSENGCVVTTRTLPTLEMLESGETVYLHSRGKNARFSSIGWGIVKTKLTAKHSLNKND